VLLRLSEEKWNIKRKWNLKISRILNQRYTYISKIEAWVRVTNKSNQLKFSKIPMIYHWGRKRRMKEMEMDIKMIPRIANSKEL
jgi:hypothetical protein